MSLRIYEPRPFAPMVGDLFAQHDRCALWAKPGMGKTTLVLTYLQAQYTVMGEQYPTLVIAPKRVARDTWTGEAAKWEHLKGLEISPVIGDPDMRRRALKRDVPIFTINYDQLPWLVDYFQQSWPFREVIADEAHNLKGFRLSQGGERAQAVARVARNLVKRWRNLTGTPSPNGLRDVWGPTWYLDFGERLGNSFSSYEERWFRCIRVQDNYTKWIPTEFAQDAIQAKLADICLSLDPRDWFDLKDPIVKTIDVVLPRSARLKYDEMEKELFTVLEGGEEIEANDAGGKSDKCLQLANGAVYLDPERYGKGQWIEVHDEKLQALSDLAAATGDDPLVVVYHFKSDLARLKRVFKDALVLANEEDLVQAKQGKGKLWLAQPQAVGEGIDGLQRWCNSIVYFAQTWRLDSHDQVLERIGPMRQFQEGLDRPVYVYYLVAKDTLDEVVMARREGKRESQDALMEYMKRKSK